MYGACYARPLQRKLIGAASHKIFSKTLDRILCEYCTIRLVQRTLPCSSKSTSPTALAIYDQVVRQIKFAVAGGVLKEGELVPSVRELARELTINPNTVARAYRQLQDDGVLTSVRGTGLAVAAGAGRALPGGAGRTDPHAARTGLRRGPAESASIREASLANAVGGTAVERETEIAAHRLSQRAKGE